MRTSAFQIASRYVGLAEVPGAEDNPAILAMLRLDAGWPESDEVPWCSAFVNQVAWLLRLPRSKSLRARSWLQVGYMIGLDDALPENDVVVLKQADGDPGPDVIKARGHVGFFAGWDPNRNEVYILGGNQSNRVSVSRYPGSRLLGVRRLITEGGSYA